MGNVKSEIPVGKIEGRKLLRTSRCIWENIIKMDLTVTVWEVVQRIYLAQDRASESFEYNNEPSSFIEFGSFLRRWVTISFSRRTLLHGVGAVHQILFKETVYHKHMILKTVNVWTIQFRTKFRN
jgi:hypothetical protein